MKVRRLLFGTLGLLALAAGLVTKSGQGVVSSLTATLGSDYALVAALAGAALVAALPVVVSGREGALDQAETPEPERPVERPPAGRDFDETIHGWRFRLPVVGDGARRETRDRLRGAAVGAVMRAEDCDRELATGLVKRGEWTDDPTAARFLDRSGGGAASAVGSLAGFETPTERAARATAEAIAALDEADGRRPNETDATSSTRTEAR